MRARKITDTFSLFILFSLFISGKLQIFLLFIIRPEIFLHAC